LLVVLDIHLSSNKVFDAREKRVVKGVDIKEIQSREKRHERAEKRRNDSERMKKRGCKL